MLHWQCPYSPGGTPNVLPFIPFYQFRSMFPDQPRTTLPGRTSHSERQLCNGQLPGRI